MCRFHLVFQNIELLKFISERYFIRVLTLLDATCYNLQCVLLGAVNYSLGRVKITGLIVDSRAVIKYTPVSKRRCVETIPSVT
jgi:hypothetical protein